MVDSNHNSTSIHRIYRIKSLTIVVDKTRAADGTLLLQGKAARRGAMAL